MKQAIFSALPKVVSPDTILASNTSSISITKIASAAIPDVSSTSAKGLQITSRVVGLHYFNPVPVMVRIR